MNPPSATIVAGATTLFAATVSGSTDTGVTWSITPSTGSISSSGLYTAPASVASPVTVTVRATSVADSTKSATATVTVNPPVTVTVMPKITQLYPNGTIQLSAVLTGTANEAVSWSLSPGVGSISPSGLFTAPATVTSPLTVIATARSAADQAKSDTAEITILPPVAVSVTPSSGYVIPGTSLALAATVANSANTEVNWTRSPEFGTVNSAGVYTAPAVMTFQVSVTITATSKADPTKSARAVLLVGPPATVTLNAPSAIAPGNAVFVSRKVIGVSNTTLIWTMSPELGTLSNVGAYTAPATLAAPATVTIRATCAVDPRATATVSIVINPNAVVTVTPPVSDVLAGGTKDFDSFIEGIDNKNVRWTVVPAIGTITTAGLYTAPAVVTQTQTVSVIATSTADPSKSAAATVTLYPAGTLLLTPRVATLRAGQQQVFGANQTVAYSISPNIGTMNGSTYTAPAAVAGTQVVTVTAVNTADPTKTATAVITLQP